MKLYEISLSSFYLGQGYDDDDDDEENNDTMVNWGFTWCIVWAPSGRDHLTNWFSQRCLNSYSMCSASLDFRGQSVFKEFNTHIFNLFYQYFATVGQRSSGVQCDISPPWYLGIIVNILWVEKYLCTTILDEFHLFFIFEKSQTVIFQQCRTVWHAVFSWLSYFWTGKPGRWHSMFLVIVLT